LATLIIMQDGTGLKHNELAWFAARAIADHTLRTAAVAILEHGVVVIGRHNDEADQRRTIDSALPLDSIRRLIQRVVRPPRVNSKAPQA
jgi:hypothetical protein